MKNEVIQFIGATGNLKDITSKEVFFEEVKKLIPLIQEELDELRESCNLEFVHGALDDYVDLSVYLIQLGSLLERVGCDIVGAKAAVADNNSLKYTTSEILAESWWEDHNTSGVPPWENPYYVDSNYYDGETYYCLKRRDTDKVSKWVGFPKVSLDEFVPSGFGGDL